MSLKRKRNVKIDDINFKCAVVAEKGLCLTYDTANAGFVRIPTTLAIGDKCAGVLMIDVVNKDFGAVPQNFQKLETGLSGHVRLLKEGELGTDRTASGAVFGPGSGVFLADGGLIDNTADATVNERIGTCLEAADGNGHVLVYFDID